jgi:hypothetical protein
MESVGKTVLLTKRPPAMRTAPVARLFSAFCLLALVARGAGGAEPSLVVFGAALKTGEVGRVSVRLTHTDPVQGFRLALQVSPDQALVEDISITGTATAQAGAERAILKVLADGASADVLLDADPPFAGQVLPPAADQEILFLRMRAVAVPPPGIDPVVAPISIADTAAGADFPPTVQIGGQPVGRAEGLQTSDGNLSIFPMSDDLLAIPNLTFDCLSPAPLEVPVLLTNPSGPVEAFSISVAHDPVVLELKGISLEGTITAQKFPEFVDVELYTQGGTIGVVLDLLPPFEGQLIPLGNGRPIAVYQYLPINFQSPDRPTVVTTVRLVDDLFGDPPLQNLLVVHGEARRPITAEGVITVYPCNIGPIQFCVGAPGPDGSVISPVGYRGQDCLKVGLFYRSPFFLQGLSMALAYDECLTGVDGSLELVNPESLIAVVGDFIEKKIDFFSYEFDNSLADGDGKELVLGLLVEALPPFEDKRLRDSDTPLLFAQMCFKVCSTVTAPVVLPIEFREGLNGLGRVQIFNRAVVDNYSIRPEFCQKPVVVLDKPPPPLPPGPNFVRGDCNGSQRLDVSDAAAVVAIFGFRHIPDGSVVYPIHFDPPCLDACDANDDGRVDFADAVAILRYLFKDREPLPAPGPVAPGPDPTEDKLSCDIGS